MSLPTFRRAPGTLLGETEADDPSAWLRAARAARDAGDPGAALELYERFFDVTGQDESGSFYGVRLSYCLQEWAELGEEHPPAQARLLWKKDESRRLLNETRDPERFQDFRAICEALGDGGSPVGVFLDLHERDRDLAAAVYRFISHELVDFGLWSVASAYLPQPRADYERAIERFVETIRAGEENPAWGGEEFAERARRWAIEDLRDLWLVLSNAGRADEAQALRSSAEADARLVPHPSVVAAAFAPGEVSPSA